MWLCSCGIVDWWRYGVVDVYIYELLSCGVVELYICIVWSCGVVELLRCGVVYVWSFGVV